MLDQLAPLAARAAAMLRERSQTIAVADGATGGLISAGLLTVPGASSFYVGGGIVYSFHGRDVLFGLDRRDYAGMKSVTEPYALLQARAIRDRFKADWGLAETGAAGGSVHRLGVPSGESCIAVVGPGASHSIRLETHADDRIANMQAFALAALTLLVDVLAEVELGGGR